MPKTKLSSLPSLISFSSSPPSKESRGGGERGRGEEEGKGKG